ncbi:MAG: hypothetical protein V1920_05260 [Bacillota bacterium]
MWWNSLNSFQQIMFVMAVTASAVMVIFIVLMLIGMDGSDFDGIDASDMDVDIINDEPFSSIGGLRLLTVRGILAFISIGGWAAFLFANFMSSLWASLIGIVFGAIASYLLALAFRAAYRLESTGNLDYSNAIGKKGTVYIRIPKAKSGKGKVTLTMQERFIEVDAITEENQDLMPKTEIEVVAVVDTTTLIVKSK